MNYRKAAVLIALHAIWIGHVQASQPGPYAGVALGLVRSGLSSEFKDSLARGFGSASLSEDGSDAGLRASLGYRFGRHFAIEGGWGDYGSVDATAATTLPLARIGAARETTAWHLDAVGILPLGERVDLTGRLGVAFWRVETTTTTTLPVSSVSASARATQHGSAPRLGVGLQYRLTDATRLALDLESFRAGKGSDVGRSTVTTLFAGIRFSF